MIYYPVIIPTLCRYEHFKRCVESLARCTHAEYTELIIGLDYPLKECHWNGYRLLCEYIPTIKGFKRVLCFKREHNYGAIANGDDLVEYVFKCNDAVILSEDDNEFSPCFLDYMNKALEMYKNEERIVSISGYTHREFEGIAKSDVLFTYDNNAWGIGIWRDKELNNEVTYQYYMELWKSSRAFFSLIATSPSIAYMFSTMIIKKQKWGDVMRTVKNINENKFQVRPYHSLVRNYGNDGSGLHSGVDDRFLKQEILNEDFFQLKNSRISNSIPQNKMFYFQSAHNKLKLWGRIIKCIGCYCRYRLTLNNV
ncbi:hypothetical protein [uncultured Bacteroides sp.]|uniref:hypothetical protein n=1 Tax=uncultured Bacteroides sp. TaxID=162156 RepID=UPI0025F117EB|nr:hypothetical protein [uncultured Bacteroides sp.]